MKQTVMSVRISLAAPACFRALFTAQIRRRQWPHIWPEEVKALHSDGEPAGPNLLGQILRKPNMAGQTERVRRTMSAFGGKADIGWTLVNVRF